MLHVWEAIKAQSNGSKTTELILPFAWHAVCEHAVEGGSWQLAALLQPLDERMPDCGFKKVFV